MEEIGKFIVAEYALVLGRRGVKRLRTFAAFSAGDCAAHVMRYPHILRMPVTGRWHAHTGTEKHHSEDPALVVMYDTPRVREAFGIPQDYPARVVLGPDGSAIVADGRSVPVRVQ